MRNLFVALWIALLLPACAHRFVNKINKKIDHYEYMQHGRMGIKHSPHNAPDVSFMLAFSGGGTRAAALSYGVLETLSEVMVPQAGADGAEGYHRLLDEVDYLSTVSGGSFTGAYYALYGDRIFQEFPDKFLYRKIQWSLFWRLMAPWNWLKLASGEYGRTDLAADYYDETIFNGATYQTLRDHGVAGLAVQSTDVVEGSRFGFTPDFFSRICSDWAAFPVARAVAASSAFPGPFGAVTMQNYAGTCDFKEERWIQEAIDKRDTTSREFYLAKSLRAYQTQKEMPYIHLLDGGISDNLGLRGPLESTTGRGGYVKSLKSQGREKTKKMVLIVVNAQTDTSRKWALAKVSPGFAQMVGAVSTIMINRYNFETIELVRASMKQWAQELKDQMGRDHAETDFYLIEVSFNALHSADERAVFCDMPTSLGLPREDVDRLRDVAKQILWESDEFKRLVHDMGGDVPAPTPDL